MSATDVAKDMDNWNTITAISTVAVLVAYYVFNVAHKPKIYSSNEILQRFLDNHITCLKDKYWPSWFSWGGIPQTALGLTLRLSRDKKLPYRRKILQLKDGGQLALDFLGEQNAEASEEEKMIVLILPGLTSSSKTSYIKTLVMTIENTGKAMVVVMNNRGLGGIELKTPRTYCVTNCEDLREVINCLKEEFPNRKFLAIGTSLGGMILCRYLINYPADAKQTFTAAMVISICWDSMIGNASLEKPLLNKYVVNYVLTSNLQELAKRHLKVLETRGCWDFDKILSVKTIREFDHHFTAPQFGYKSWEEYYRAAQISPEVHKFSIPVFGLNAFDDPIQPGEDLPIKEATEEGSNLALIVTERGGHLGFLDGVFPFRKPFHFMERVVEQFVEAMALHADDLEDYDSRKNRNCDKAEAC